jgi:UDP-N-acetylglucosamine diphosphorylase / glucose-1-phosphate thymidylyltransferase / UDP-N-acetylgalactosamine diphosphorylase / glucosamine-1-phosphate N-acetyltransferase / galactosamine-1-phosphate N-acetyltransferase
MRTAGEGRGLSPQSSVLSTAVVLAAGAGTRLGELGRRYSKPMVPLNGRPLIDWVLRRLQAAGIERVIVVRYVEDVPLTIFLRAEHRGVEIVTQSERRGIGDALRQARALVAAEPAYLACACDSLFEVEDLCRVIECGRRDASTAALGVLEMGAAATAARSAVRLDGDRVLEIIEKPPPGTAPSGLVAMPLYWLPRSAAVYIENVAPVGNEAYISTALNDFIRAGGLVRAVRVRWRMEITTAADVDAVEKLLKGG